MVIETFTSESEVNTTYGDVVARSLQDTGEGPHGHACQGHMHASRQAQRHPCGLVSVAAGASSPPHVHHSAAPAACAGVGDKLPVKELASVVDPLISPFIDPFVGAPARCPCSLPIPEPCLCLAEARVHARTRCFWVTSAVLPTLFLLHACRRGHQGSPQRKSWRNQEHGEWARWAQGAKQGGMHHSGPS